jgi:hypothetical protein
MALSSAAVLAGAGIALGVAASSGTGVPPFAAAAKPVHFVLVAADKTLEQGTAHVALSGNVTLSGRSIPVRGSGNLDLSRASADLYLSSNDVDERELVFRGQMYFGLTIDGERLPAALDSGREWVQLPTPVGASTNGSSQNVNPVGLILIARSPGDAVVSVGTAMLDGVAVEGFAVTPTRAAIDRAVGRIASQDGLSRSGLSAAESLTRSFTFELWFDESGLLRQEVVNIDPSNSTRTSGRFTMTVESYGNPVHIDRPGPGEVLSYKDFSADARASGAHI